MTDLIALLEPFRGWLGIALLLVLLFVDGVTDDPEDDPDWR
jgi:hypothetical protein